MSTLIIRIIGPKKSAEQPKSQAYRKDGMVSIPVRSKASRTASKLARRRPPSRPETHPVYASSANARQPGAVRTSVAAKKSSNGAGRGIALAIAVTASIGWILGAATSKSEEAQSHAAIPSSLIAQASVSPPVFFFDDHENALAQMTSSDTAYSPFEPRRTPDTGQPADGNRAKDEQTDVSELTVIDAPTPNLGNPADGTTNAAALNAQDIPSESNESIASDKQTVDNSSPVPMVFYPENHTESALRTSISRSIAAAPKSVPLPAAEPVAVDPDQLRGPNENQMPAKTDMVTIAVTVKAGDTLSGILNMHGVGIEKMPQLLNNEVIKEYLSNLEVGQKFELTQKNGDFYDLSARIGGEKRITIKQADSGLVISSEELPAQKVQVVTTGTIEQSLYLAAEKAQLKQSTIMKLADIFQWELDFAKDIRKGDKFSLVFDKHYRGGEYVRDGEILAAQFVRGGKTHTAIHFTNEEGNSAYYSPDGKSKQRTFLRHPVDDVRITSRFNPNRMHPLLQKVRAHRGVDYGAPYGSPIFATADGKVEFSGFQNSYGNVVILKHGDRFSTLYAHMSKIAGKARNGSKVQQGDVIGYVGKSGRVTGVHLHYEFRINGVHVDPLTVELPEANSIDKRYLSELKAQAEELQLKMRTASDRSSESVAQNQADDQISSELVADSKAVANKIEFK